MQDEQTLRRWILGRLNKEQKLITERALAVFMERTGKRHGKYRIGAGKAALLYAGKAGYHRGRCGCNLYRQINNRIFDMIEAVASKRQEAALELYYDLLALEGTTDAYPFSDRQTV